MASSQTKSAQIPEIEGSRRTLVRSADSSFGPVQYVGKRTETGNSTGFRFEGALFKSHPEFNGAVRAQVIAPGRMLVTAEPVDRAEDDPGKVP